MTFELFVTLSTLDRMAALAQYDLEDRLLREQLDALCARTSARLGMPMSMTSVVLDTAQYFVGSHGLTGWVAEVGGTPAEWAFCAHAVVAGQPLYVVSDATTHPAHRDSPLVTQEGQRSYAGASIYAPDGQILGMQCVVDTRPHQFTEVELSLLTTAAGEASSILEASRASTRTAGTGS